MKKSSPRAKKIALDSNIFIYYFGGNPEFGPATEKLFNSLSKRKAVTSVISLIELLSFRAPSSSIEKAKETFFTIPNLEIVDTNREIADLAARIRRDYSFSLPDAIQLATALFSKADLFITNDYRLKRFKELKIQSLSG